MQEVEAIIKQFRGVDYKDFRLDTLSKLASALNWELILSPGGGCIVFCKFLSNGRRWAFGYSEDEDCHKFEWFVITLFLWENFELEDYETIEAYQLERQRYDDYYLTVKQRITKLLGEPEFVTTRRPENYSQAAWGLTNGIMYLYQGPRDIQFGIEISLFFKPLNTSEVIPELKF